jgi:hypothetical protein
VGFSGTPNQLDITNTRGGVRLIGTGGDMVFDNGQVRCQAPGAYAEPSGASGVLHYNTASNVFTIDARSSTGSSVMSFRTSDNGVSAQRILVTNAGHVSIINLAGTGNRAVYSDMSGYLTNASSDATLKTNLATVTDGASIVAALRPVRFDWIDQQARGAQREIGLVAQEVATVLPEVVGTNNNGTLSVDYSHIVAVLIGAVQDLQAKVAALEAAKP